MEKVIFYILSFPLLVLMNIKNIAKKNMVYIISIIIQVISIILSLINLVFKWHNIVLNCFVYIFAVIIPFLICYREYKGGNVFESIYIFIAKKAIVLGNIKLAKTILNKLIDMYPNSARAHRLLGRIYEKEGGLRKAIDEYIKAVDINKKDYNTYYRIAVLLNELKQKDQAITLLTMLLNKKPEFKAAIMLLGDILCEENRLKEALSIYNDALKYYKEDYEIYYNLGMVYTMLNDFSNAKLCYDKAAKINSLLYVGYYCNGKISLMYGDLDEAKKYFEMSLLSKDVEARSYYNLAMVYILKDDKDNAIKNLNVAIELDYGTMKMINQEPLFIKIKGYLDYPLVDEEDYIEKEYNLTKKEKRVCDYLDETYKVIDNLNQNSSKGNIQEKAKEKNKENSKTIEEILNESKNKEIEIM